MADMETMERLKDDVQRLSYKVEKIQEWKTVQETQTALATERYSNINSRLDKIDGHMAKLIWIILVGILGAAGSFILSGGLNVVK